MNAEDYARAESLLADPDAEDCERFSSWFGSVLLAKARACDALLDSAQALGVIGGGYCFCSADRDPDKAAHEPECRDLRAAIAGAEAF